MSTDDFKVRYEYTPMCYTPLAKATPNFVSMLDGSEISLKELNRELYDVLPKLVKWHPENRISRRLLHKYYTKEE